MADLTSIVDFDSIPQNDEFAPLPSGWYKVVVIGTELKQTKSGTGSYLKVQYQVVDGQYQNRTVFQNLNLVNDNPVAVKIGQQQLGQVVRACGLESIRDSSEMHAKVLEIELKVRKSEDYGDSNEVKKARAVRNGSQVVAESEEGPVAF